MACPIVMICVAASKPAVDAIGAALGYGPVSVDVRLTDDPDAVDWDSNVSGPWPGPVTAYGTSNGNIEKPDADVWLAISNGVLPATLPGGREWGVAGVISEADALAAVTPGGKLEVWQGSSDADAYATFWGIVAGKGLYRFPADPI